MKKYNIICLQLVKTVAAFNAMVGTGIAIVGVKTRILGGTNNLCAIIAAILVAFVVQVSTLFIYYFHKRDY